MLNAGLCDFDAASEGRSPTRAASKSSRRLCRRRDRLQGEVGLIGRARVKARMRAPPVIKIQISAKRGARLEDAVVGAQIDLLVFDAAPQPLDKHIVAPGTLAVHADRYAIAYQHAREGLAGELAALIRVEYFWLA